MPKYNVLLTQTTIEEAYVTVEAENPRAAEDAAREMALSGEVTWRFCMAAGDIEADAECITFAH